MGRPTGSFEVRFPMEDLIKYAKTGATQRELAQRLGVSLPTLERRLKMKKYREAYDAARGELFTSLRATQIRVAMGLDVQGKPTQPPNVQMLKWLGEQYLGQAHAHKLVDQEGKDRDMNLASVRAYMQDVPAEETE